VPADDKQGKWIVDPFQMKGINGYLYGRGVSDNKGPIMAALYGVVDLIHDKKLDSDITFLIEGEEESGSRGFKDAVRKHKELIGEIDYIIVANSYWLDDEVPCLTYGLRGVLHATVKVDSNHPDVHSGVDGSFMMDEPLFDLTAILARLKGLHNRIQIPGFYDDILSLTPAEEARYDDITDTLIKRNPDLGPAETLKVSLMARWREPNLTIHRYKVSGPDGSLVSSHARAAISVRLVPNQEVEDVIKSLTTFLSDAFATLDTHNRFSITIDNQADAWLGDPDNEIFRTLEEAVMEVWGPIGEGTRRPSVPGNRTKEKEKQAQNPTQSPSLKPSPATTTTLTQGSDYTSLASSIHQPLPTPTLPAPPPDPATSSSDTQPAIPVRRSSKSSKGSSITETTSRPTDLSSLPSQKSFNANHPARSSSISVTNSRSRSASSSNTLTPKPVASPPQLSPARKPLPTLPAEKPKGRKPLYIREGGSIPGIRFLEKEFNAPAAHLPCGQASDAAHLDNERLRISNLMKSRIIFGKVFGRLGSR
jgi:di- and tripeptidase